MKQINWITLHGKNKKIINNEEWKTVKEFGKSKEKVHMIVIYHF